MANEKRLIDANAALEKVCENCCCDFEECKQVGFCVDYENINQLPTVDAVEVVRCKDCNYFGGHGACHAHAADVYGTPIFVREDDFCSYGERREGE